MPQNTFRSIFLDHPDSSQLEIALNNFEEHLSAGNLHATARQGLTGKNELAFTEPFPKIESHDTYLYGVFATPTDIDDGQSRFFNVQFVVNEQMALVVLWGSDESVTNRARDLFSRISGIANAQRPLALGSDGEPGDFAGWLERRRVQDRDLWIIELDIPQGERFIGL